MKYRLSERLFPLKEDGAYGGKDIRIELVTRREFEDNKEALPHRRVLLQHMERIQYCKAEMFGNCIVGTFAAPNVKNLPAKKTDFGFYVTKDRVVLVEDEGEYAKGILKKMQEIEYGKDVSVAGFFTGFLNFLIDGDSLFLQEYENKLIELEDEMAHIARKHSYEKIMRCRKDMLHLHAFFAQLEDLGDVFRSNANHLFSEEEREIFAVFSQRVGRLKNHTQMLREYIVQIREMYQSQLDLEQNKTMNMLTVITAVFLPLSLIAGWYGMNFTNMPELTWKYGYLVIFLMSAAIVLMEIFFFKRKRLL